MPVIRLTKQFDFEMAHALWNYDGKCRYIHGHSYKLLVTIIGKPLIDRNNPKLGMVMDFGILKKIVKQQIVDKYDHALVINQNADVSNLSKTEQMTGKIITKPYQPTCENLVAEFAQCLQECLPSEVKLYSLRLYETANSFAEWFQSDNR